MEKKPPYNSLDTMTAIATHSCSECRLFQGGVGDANCAEWEGNGAFSFVLITFTSEVAWIRV